MILLRFQTENFGGGLKKFIIHLPPALVNCFERLVVGSINFAPRSKTIRKNQFVKEQRNFIEKKQKCQVFFN